MVGLVVHPSGKQKYAEEIISTANLSSSRVFEASQLRTPETLKAMAELKADVALSIFFGYILRTEFLDLFPKGCINLHPALLPYNRGAYPNVWSIIDGTPAGVTLHYIDQGVDTGDIIAQQEVPVDETDTGKTLYSKLETASVELFVKTWPAIHMQQITPFPQSEANGTAHRLHDVEDIDQIELDKAYKATDLINILRARTFPPYKGSYFLNSSGKKVFMRLELIRDEEETS